VQVSVCHASQTVPNPTDRVVNQIASSWILPRSWNLRLRGHAFRQTGQLLKALGIATFSNYEAKAFQQIENNHRGAVAPMAQR
jgi:hypothetical protein